MSSATREDVSTGAGAEDVLVSTSSNPTRTQTVEERYGQALRGGYQRINAIIREYVGRRDVLALEGELTAVQPPRDFSFQRDDRKIEGFRDWLDRAQEDEVLDVIGQGENRYVRQAYETGVRTTNADLRQAKFADPDMDVAAVTRLPVHERTLQRLYTRNFSELKGLTDEMGRRISRELTEAMAEGAGPNDAARRITDIIGSIEDGTPHGAMARATTIARTEILRARHLGAQEQYQRFGVKLIEPILAPTACPECVAIAADAPYRVDQIGNIWPIHPNCRCSVTIYTGSADAVAGAIRVPAHRAEAFAEARIPMTPRRLHATAA